MELRALRESDDRSRFHSGNFALDEFFRRYAGQNQFRHHVGITYVAVEGENILGYATVSSGDLEIEHLPEKLRRKLPRYPLPILRLARLAVDAFVQSQGLGKELLRFVLQLALHQRNATGCIGVVADAKPEAVAFYAKYGFIMLDVLEGQSDARPQPAPMFLALGLVEKVR